MARTPAASVDRHAGAIRDRLARSAHARPGPDSVTWTINREMIVVAGWGRAILMQIAHPAIGAGVHRHSSFRGSLRSGLARLHGTVSAMLAIIFGDDERAIRAAAGINAIHDRIHNDAGERPTYSAHDPELQRWVHATLLESIPLTYQRLVGPLTAAQRDRYCAEGAIMEPLLGMPEGWLPRNAAELDRYVDTMLSGGTLVVNDTARALARAVLYPPHWRFAWPAFRFMQLLTIGSLPPSLRDAYRFDWTPREQRAFERWTTCVRIALRVFPSFARQWPMARRRAAPAHSPAFPRDASAST